MSSVFFGGNSNNIKSNFIKSSLVADIYTVPQRTLYTESLLGLNKQEGLRKKYIDKNVPLKPIYIRRLTACLDSSNFDSFLKSDFSVLIEMTDDEEQLSFIERVIAAIKDQEHLACRGCPTSLVRRYYDMGLLDRAYKNFMDKDTFGKFFDEFTGTKIMLTWLFKEGKYNEVLKLYKTAIQRIDFDEPATKHQLDLVALGALAKIDTPQALKDAEEIYELTRNAEMYIMGRMTGFVAFLALRHGQAVKCLNYLYSFDQKRRYVALRELRARAWLKLKCYEDLLFHLQSESDFERRPVISVELCNSIEEIQDDIEDANIREQIIDCLLKLKKSNLVSEFDLENLIFHETSRERTQVRDAQPRGGLQSRDNTVSPSYSRDQSGYMRETRRHYEPRTDDRRDQRSFNRRNNESQFDEDEFEEDSEERPTRNNFGRFR